MSNDGHVAAAAWGRGGQGLYYDDKTVFAPASLFFDPEFDASSTFLLKSFDVGGGGRVVFAANWADIGTGIYIWDDGVVWRLPGSRIGDGIPVLSIDDNGVVAAGYHDRISVFHDGREDTVIQIGSPYDGSTVTGLGFSQDGFNDVEQVAFFASLADGLGTSSSLVTLPEPGAPLLLVAAATALMRRQRQRVDRT